MDSIHDFSGNRILASLHEATRQRLVPHLKAVKAEPGEILYGPGATLHKYVYFPVSAIISHLYVMENGKAAEISLIGHEGMLGIGLILGGEATHSQAVVQHARRMYSLPAAVLKREFEAEAEVRALLLSYAQVLLMQTAQTAVCNRHHRLEQQLCRWLLMSLDRVQSNEISMTQELIANMLGVRREGITEVAGKLQREGAITYRRGHITVTDRDLLGRICCECYAVVEKEAARLMKSYLDYN